MTTSVDQQPLSGVWTANGLALRCPEYDDAIRWRRGERLEHLFERKCDWLRKHGDADQLAVDTGDETLTYDELDVRANQLARHLIATGARAGDRIGLLFDEPVQAYVGMLAVLKVNAAYVPLDAAFPADRVAYIAQDAGVRTVLTLAHLLDTLALADVTAVNVDEARAAIAARASGRLSSAERGEPVDELCYIVYTSGTTGRPKGVAIAHASICNFVAVADEVYGVIQTDRVYQGLTIAFDFSVEEIWVAWAAGATLVPKPGGASLLGHELHDFLRSRRVTALCCVPTLLATVEEDLPDLRFLLVSGEACPQNLVDRWHRPGRRFLNVYGPTEATVTATWTPLKPGRPVTLGVPLPTYSVVILDTDETRALPPGAVGEIGIGGVGLATGYLNRDDLTARAFVPDFVGLPSNPSGRIYRTGDLGRINEDGEIEYLGRLDTQVKIRGYRIELTEIESVLMEIPGVAQAVVDTYEAAPGAVDLVAYYSLRAGTASLDTGLVNDVLRGHLPGYMVPTYLEQLDVIPMTTSDKADRKALPPPRGPRSLAGQHEHVAPADEREAVLADLLGGVLGMDRVSVESHFFADLGANSLLLARFGARIRERTDLAEVSMRDVYQHPTVRQLAAALAAPGEAVGRQAPTPAPPYRRYRTTRYLACGAAQLGLFVAYGYLMAVALFAGYHWIVVDAGLVEVYLRSAVAGLLVLGAFTALPVLAKWLLIGRFRPGEIPLWGLSYLRFWTVRTLIRWSPMLMFIGSPLYNVYLRMLGAKVGPGALILTRNLPACPDLITVGASTVVSKDVFLNGYRAYAGVIQTGPVTLGRDAFIGQASVLDIDTGLGDGAQLGHASSLQRGQHVPAGARWHGSPGQPTAANFHTVPSARCGRLRRVSYSLAQIVTTLALTGSLGIALLATLVEELPVVGHVLHPQHTAITTWVFYRDTLITSAVLFLGGIVAGLAFVTTLPRLLQLAVRSDQVYPLYTFRYALQRAVAGLTNRRFFTWMFGDSVFVVPFLRLLGYDLRRVQQTGSNFGMDQRHDTPYLTVIGSGTMVSDGLSMDNAEFSATSFRLRQAVIGDRNFVGNAVHYPAGGRTGDDCLLATKVAVPIDGPIRTGVGLLGSPAFEIPRSVARDATFDDFREGETLRQRLAAKTRHNAVTLALFLLVRWLVLTGTLLLSLAAVDLMDRYGPPVLALALLLSLVYGIGVCLGAERLILATGRMVPRFCSIYDPYFWWHERFWKAPTNSYAQAFNGTPFKNVLWRLQGVKIGKRVFDDGAWISERPLVAIGDDCTLNLNSGIQSHSLEDGAFKSDRTTIGAGCTLGVGAFVHYGITVADGAVIGPDSFLMKGEQVSAYSQWAGNPARRTLIAQPAAAPAADATARGVLPAAPRMPAPRVPVDRRQAKAGA
ncbi:Pls/PosA family non-ribosomal peptide synthetase [Pilimelia columellifera]|uniref:Non-ribosomal peptide synthetase n=1 Tax=Pilimelia columellifera subsp. columellifera TaxID=706583 RepID=A0ABP6B4U9_9ACTN